MSSEPPKTSEPSDSPGYNVGPVELSSSYVMEDDHGTTLVMPNGSGKRVMHLPLGMSLKEAFQSPLRRTTSIAPPVQEVGHMVDAAQVHTDDTKLPAVTEPPQLPNRMLPQNYNKRPVPTQSPRSPASRAPPVALTPPQAQRRQLQQQSQRHAPRRRLEPAAEESTASATTREETPIHAAVSPHMNTSSPATPSNESRGAGDMLHAVPPIPSKASLLDKLTQGDDVEQELDGLHDAEESLTVPHSTAEAPSPPLGLAMGGCSPDNASNLTMHNAAGDLAPRRSTQSGAQNGAYSPQSHFLSGSSPGDFHAASTARVSLGPLSQSSTPDHRTMYSSTIGSSHVNTPTMKTLKRKAMTARLSQQTEARQEEAMTVTTTSASVHQVDTPPLKSIDDRQPAVAPSKPNTSQKTPNKRRLHKKAKVHDMQPRVATNTTAEQGSWLSWNRFTNWFSW